MKYNKLKLAIKEKGYSISKLAQEIGLTEAGFHQAIKNNTLKVRDLENIAILLDLPIASFFDESNIVLQNGNINLNGKNSGIISISDAKHEIDALHKEVYGLKEVISGMKRELELKDQIIELMKESKNLKLMKNGDKKKLD